MWYVSSPETNVYSHAEERYTLNWWIWEQQEGSSMWWQTNIHICTDIPLVAVFPWLPYYIISTGYNILLTILPHYFCYHGYNVSLGCREEEEPELSWILLCSLERFVTILSCLRKLRKHFVNIKVFLDHMPQDQICIELLESLNYWNACYQSSKKVIIASYCSVKWQH